MTAWEYEGCCEAIAPEERRRDDQDLHGRGDRLDRAGGCRRHPRCRRPRADRRARAQGGRAGRRRRPRPCADRHRSEEHTSELQSLMRISYAVFCLKTTELSTTPNHVTTSESTHTYNALT